MSHPGHALICGVTGSGKTLLARWMARSYQAQGVHCIVLDPFASDWQGPSDTAKAFVTTHKAEFLEWARTSRRCALFVDEASESARRLAEHDDMIPLATQMRHWGHVSHFIAQGPMSVRNEIRSQLVRRFIFRLEPAEAKRLHQIHGFPEYLAAADLPAGHFFYLSPFHAAQRFKVPGWIDGGRAA